MKNSLNSYKSWLTIADAATRLTKQLNEDIDVPSVLQLVIEDKFPICLHTERTPIRPVEPHYTADTDKISWQRRDDNIDFRFIDGPRTLELELTNGKKWLRQLMFPALPIPIVDNGVIIIDEDKYWIVYEPHPDKINPLKRTTSTQGSRDNFPSIEELAIRVEDIERFENSHILQPTKKRTPSNTIHPRTEKTYLNIIAALLEVVTKGIPDDEYRNNLIGPAAHFKSEKKLIQAIVAHNKDADGISKSNLEKRFPEANRQLQGSRFK